MNFYKYLALLNQSKKDCKEQESIPTSTTPGYQMGKEQNHHKHHKSSNMYTLLCVLNSPYIFSFSDLNTSSNTLENRFVALFK